jgi:calcyclin binding protein
MNMLKKMYDEGDDDMKRTIAKSYSESRSKTGGDLSGF